MYGKYNILVIFLAGLFVFATPRCHAQSAPAPIPSSDASLVKVIGKAAAFYFKTTDLIKANVFLYALGSVDDVYKNQDVITLTFSFQIPGKVLTRPDTVSVSITSKSRVPMYVKNHKLRLFADGKLIADVETDVIKPRSNGDSYATEIFGFNRLNFNTLEKVSKGKKVIVQLGDTEIQLSSDQHKAIEDFYELAKN
jgi:hypothetical protein